MYHMPERVADMKRSTSFISPLITETATRKTDGHKDGVKLAAAMYNNTEISS